MKKETEPSPASDDEVPSFEPWLKVGAASLLPVLIIGFVPKDVQYALAGIAITLALVSVGMLFMQERRRR